MRPRRSDRLATALPVAQTSPFSPDEATGAAFVRAPAPPSAVRAPAQPRRAALTHSPAIPLPSSRSAACVAAHKKASGCSGKRNRAEFVDIHSLGDRHLISDYRLLEETQQVAERAKRTYADPAAAAAAAAALQHGPFAPAPRRRERRDRQASALAALQQRAQAKGVNLMFQPAGMTRHDSNTTSFDKKGNVRPGCGAPLRQSAALSVSPRSESSQPSRTPQRMNWHVEWVFGDFRPCPVSRIREDVCPLCAPAPTPLALYCVDAPAPPLA